MVVKLTTRNSLTPRTACLIHCCLSDNKSLEGKLELKRLFSEGVVWSLSSMNKVRQGA